MSEIIETRFNLIHEHERTGESVTNICRKYSVSRRTYYKWKNRYLVQGIDGLKDRSRKPHNIGHRKVTPELEQTILGLRLDNRQVWYYQNQIQVKEAGSIIPQQQNRL